MSKTAIHFIMKFVLLVLLQAVIFNNIVLFNVAVAFVFIYIIVAMPVTWSTNLSVAIGFMAGLSIDIFSDTQGMNALACTILAFVRKPVLHLYIQRDEDFSGMDLGISTLGAPAFFKYLITMSLIYCICYFTIEALAFFHPVTMLLRICASTIFTFVIIYAVDSIFNHRNEKRL